MNANLEKLSKLFQDPEEKWLLILGSDWGASSGVPLCSLRTKWSPSIGDLVRYELFRTQSKEVFARVEEGIDASKPPLGFLADSLHEQHEWLEQYLGDITPQKAAFCLADLAKSGMFSQVITSAPDRLFEKALDLLGVSYYEEELEHRRKDLPAGALPLLREWDDLIYQDAADRMAREARFIEMRLEEALAQTHSVLVLGHHPHACSLMNGLLKQLSGDSEHKVVWVTEETLLPLQLEALQEPTSPFRILSETHQDFTPLCVDNFGDWLEDVGDLLGVESTPYEVLQEPPKGLATILNKTFDIRPILVYIPGMALFSGLLNKIPEVSVRTAISILTFLVLVIGGLNYYTYYEFEKRERSVRELLDEAESDFGKARRVARLAKDARKGKVKKGGSSRYQRFLRAEAKALQVEAAIRQFRMPAFGASTLPFLPLYMKRRLEQLQDRTYELLQFDIVPALYRERTQVALRSHPQMRSMGYYDTLLVSARKLNVERAHAPAGQSKLPRPLSSYRDRDRQILFYKSAPFLQSVMRKEMLRELKEGRLAVAVDLNEDLQANIPTLIKRQLLRAVHSRKVYKQLFDVRTVKALLKEGRISVYFIAFDVGGSISNALTQIQAFLSTYPKSRAIIGVSRNATKKAILSAIRTFVFLTISNYSYEESYAYLRKHTSYRYSQRVHDNTYLRWNWKDPLIRSLLIDTYHEVGVAPRSLGVLYERLLQTMLSQGKYSFVLKFKMLGLIAYKRAQFGQAISKEQAILTIASALHPKAPTQEIAKASKVLQEITSNGVLLFHPKDGVTFTDKRFLYVCLSKFLVKRPLADKKHLLLRMPKEMTAFYAGISPSVDTLVASWLNDYLEVDKLYREKNVHLIYTNPFLYSLSRAVLAVSNGKISHTLVQTLESILIEQSGNWNWNVQNDVVKLAVNLPTPRIQEWIVRSLDEDAPHDHRVLGVMGSVTNVIFTTSVKRWLKRIGTSRDKRLKKRWRRGHEGLPQGKRRLHIYQKWAIRNAINTLAQLKSEDTLRVVVDYVRRSKDKRFHPKDWRYIRLHAAQVLITLGKYDAIRKLYQTIEKNPQDWCYSGERGNLGTTRFFCIYDKLGPINDKQTAAFLVRMLMKKEPLTYMTTLYKPYVARALARIDDEIVVPLLRPILQQPADPKGADYRLYAALVYAYKRRLKAYPLVEKVVLSQLRWKPRTKNRQGIGYHKLYASVVLAAFRTPSAFSAFKKLYLDKKWRTMVPAHLMQALNFFRFPKARRFMLKQLHCAKTHIAYKAYVYNVFAMIKDTWGHGELSRAIQMLEEGPDQVFLKQLCGAPAPRVTPRQRLYLLIQAIGALAKFGQYTDIARIAAYTRHRSVYVQRAAMKALGTFRTRQASDALARIYKAHPRLKNEYYKALHQQRFPYNANKLVAALREEKTIRGKAYLLYYLQKAGNEAALLQVYPIQYDKVRQLVESSRYTFHHVAMQLKGRIMQMDAFKKLIRATPVASDKERTIPFYWRVRRARKGRQVKRRVRRRARRGTRRAPKRR